VAIVYDQTSDLLSALQDNAESGDTSSDQYCYKTNLKGWYRLLWDANIAVDLLSSEHLALSARYQAVILPNMMQVSTRLALTVADYVAGGGRLVVDCGFDARQPHWPGRGTSSPAQKQLHRTRGRFW
jgi:beta-galactosidase GanA